VTKTEKKERKKERKKKTERRKVVSWHKSQFGLNKEIPGRMYIAFGLSCASFYLLRPV
jgi:hypothetical protein